MRERDIYPQDCPRTVRSRRNRFGNTELACSPKYHGAKTAYWAVGRQLLPWDYFRFARQPSAISKALRRVQIEWRLLRNRNRRLLVPCTPFKQNDSWGTIGPENLSA